jgi:hypothetical protein
MSLWPVTISNYYRGFHGENIRTGHYLAQVLPEKILYDPLCDFTYPLC